MKKKTLSNQQRVHRTRVILGIIIAATIPCYCSGLILLKYYPQQSLTETPTLTLEGTTAFPTLDITTQQSSTATIILTATSSATTKWTASVTYTPFLSPTATETPTSSDTPTFTQTPIPSQTLTVPIPPTGTNTSIPASTATIIPSVKPTEEVTP